MKSPRIGIACVFHESNTGAPQRTSLEDFKRRWLVGDVILDELNGTQTATGGFIQELTKDGFRPVPTFYTWATPSGTVERSAFQAISKALADEILKAPPLDGFLLELHGAMVVDRLGSADGELAKIVRRMAGCIPIVVVLDPHANLQPTLPAAADGLLAYQTNPHVDMANAGAQAVALLNRILRDGTRPSVCSVRVPIAVPAIAQATSDEPLVTLMAEAQSETANRGLLSSSILMGFCYADVYDMGMSTVAVGERPAAMAAVTSLARRCWELREGFARTLTAPNEAVALAAAADGLAALVDVGDNVGGGAAGNSTVLLEAVVAHGGLRVATTLWDPVAVETAAAAGSGARITLAVGAPPLTLHAQVRSVTDGRYVNDGPLSAGVEFDMGRVALVEAAGLTVVLQTHPVMANDQNMFRSVGVDLDSLDAVILKGAVAVRAGWASRVRRFIDVATPGATTVDVSALELRHVRRPIWPIDAFCWTPSNEEGPHHGSP